MIIKIYTGVILAVVASVSGCGWAENRSAGPVGAIQDNLIYDVQSKTGIAHRAMVVTAALSKVAAENITSSGDRRQAIAQINALKVDIESLYYDIIYGCGGVIRPSPESRYEIDLTGMENGGTCSKGGKKGFYATNFESDLQDTNYDLFRLAATALPRKQFADLISKSKSSNYLDLIYGAIEAVFSLVETGDTIYAVGRESTEERYFSLHAHGESFDQTYNGTFRSTAKLIDSATNANLYEPSQVYFQALFKVAAKSCFALRHELTAAEKALASDNNCPLDFLGADIDVTTLRVASDDPQALVRAITYTYTIPGPAGSKLGEAGVPLEKVYTEIRTQFKADADFRGAGVTLEEEPGVASNGPITFKMTQAFSLKATVGVGNAPENAPINGEKGKQVLTLSGTTREGDAIVVTAMPDASKPAISFKYSVPATPGADVSTWVQDFLENFLRNSDFKSAGVTASKVAGSDQQISFLLSTKTPFLLSVSVVSSSPAEKAVIDTASPQTLTISGTPRVGDTISISGTPPTKTADTTS